MNVSPYRDPAETESEPETVHYCSECRHKTFSVRADMCAAKTLSRTSPEALVNGPVRPRCIDRRKETGPTCPDYEAKP